MIKEWLTFDEGVYTISGGIVNIGHVSQNKENNTTGHGECVITNNVYNIHNILRRSFGFS